MEDLVTWLRQQLDEDERLAKKAGEAMGFDDPCFPDYRTYDGWELEAADAFIAHLSPARVLREVESKRAILDAHQRTTFTDVDLGIRDQAVCAICHGALDPGEDWDGGALRIVQLEWPCPTVRYLAAVFADRPRYQEP